LISFIVGWEITRATLGSLWTVLATVFQGVHPVVEEMPIGLTAVVLVGASVLLIVRLSSRRDAGSARATTDDRWIRRAVLLFALPPLVVAVGVSGACSPWSASSIRRRSGEGSSAGATGSGRAPGPSGRSWASSCSPAWRELSMRGARRRIYPGLIAFTSWGLALVHLYQCVLMLVANVYDLSRPAAKSLMPVQWGLCIAAGVAAVVGYARDAAGIRSMRWAARVGVWRPRGGTAGRRTRDGSAGMNDRERRAAGATAAGPRGRGWRLLLWVVLAVLVLAALLFALSRCGAGGDPGAGGTGAPAANPPAAPASPTAGPTAAAAPTSAAAPTGPGAATPAPEPAPAGGAGSLAAGGAALLPVSQAADADGSLAGLVGRDVTADGVAVQSVPADEGFWVGTSATDRIWVQLEGGGESGYTVRPGDRVSFSGRLVANPAGFAQRSGVDAAEGAAQLDRQAAHVIVRQADLRGTSR
jgi:hypothetical protein